MQQQAGKGVGFRRNIFLDWLDAAASAALATDDIAAARAGLAPVVAARLDSPDTQRMAVEILITIWVKSAGAQPQLHGAALDFYRASAGPADRLWLHYGMTLLAYDFFAACAGAIGQMSRTQDDITAAEARRVLVAERGALGSLNQAVDRVIFSLRDWGILLPGARRSAYAPQRRCFAASSRQLEAWLLAVVLAVHPGEELPFADLMRRPELFPFALSITVDELRLHPWFAVHRQGGGIDMVRQIAERPAG